MNVFEEHGVRFEYPSDWTLSQDSEDGNVAITVESGGTAFWMLTILQDRPPAEEVIQAAVDSLQDEYDDCDIYESSEQICLLPTEGCDVDFSCMELINRACLRSCEGDTTSLFVLYQTSDIEAEETTPVLQAMTQSLFWEIATEMDDDFGADPAEFDNLFGGAE
ncbi:MAG: hypothetical protein O2820_14720 [Planctomycetota bacterium]|nr:hypothetical protein [Planctomycetota bacterium]MDA1250468.1 hypothetical protein [Planctomycetota bacterium]